MKKIISVILLQFFLGVSLLQAAPNAVDSNNANALIYTIQSDQNLHFTETSNYESVMPKSYAGLIYYSCAYSTFNGKGYVASVIKIENGKVWKIQVHIGPENPSIDETWTCQNCNGGAFNWPSVNEHGLCQLSDL